MQGGYDSGLVLFPLHSSLSSAEQKEVFNPAPQGKRKVLSLPPPIPPSLVTPCTLHP